MRSTRVALFAGRVALGMLMPRFYPSSPDTEDNAALCFARVKRRELNILRVKSEEAGRGASPPPAAAYVWAELASHSRFRPHLA